MLKQKRCSSALEELFIELTNEESIELLERFELRSLLNVIDHSDRAHELVWDTNLIQSKILQTPAEELLAIGHNHKEIAEVIINTPELANDLEKQQVQVILACEYPDIFLEDPQEFWESTLKKPGLLQDTARKSPRHSEKLHEIYEQLTSASPKPILWRAKPIHHVGAGKWGCLPFALSWLFLRK